MSIDYSTYVGPYVRCEVGVKKVAGSFPGCPTPDCREFQKERHAAFCSACGAPIIPLPYETEVDAVDAWDITEAIQERLTTAHGDAYMDWSQVNMAHLWMPNTGGIGRHLEGKEDFSFDDITAEIVAVEIAAFTTFFATELSALIAAYGDGRVVVRWGVIQDYS